MCIDSSTYAYDALPFLFAALFGGLAYLLSARLGRSRRYVIAVASILGLGVGYVIVMFSGTLRC